MKIMILDVTGRRLNLEVSEDSTILEGKSKLQNLYPVEIQRWVHMGQELENEKLFSDYNIREGSTIYTIPSTFGKRQLPKLKEGEKYTRSQKSGLIMSVDLIENLLKNSNQNLKVEEGASIYTSALLEYIIAELTELSGRHAMNNKRREIQPRDILTTLEKDDELGKLGESTWFPLIKRVVQKEEEEGDWGGKSGS